MTLRARAFLAALAVAAAAGAQAQPLRARPADQAVLREAAEAQIVEALSLFDARRLIPLAAGGVDRPAGVSDDDARRARQLLLSAAYAGSPEARDYAARMLQAGVGGPVDAAGARRLYEESATRSARWRLAGMLERGEGGPKDLASARALYKLASTQGQLDARYDFARMLRRGEGGKPDPAAAYAALAGMAATRHADAAGERADMLDRGEGVPRDPKAAADQYLLALEWRSRFYAVPRVAAKWSAIGRETRMEIGERLRERGLPDAPIDGSPPPKGWEERYLTARKDGSGSVHSPL